MNSSFCCSFSRSLLSWLLFLLLLLLLTQTWAPHPLHRQSRPSSFPFPCNNTTNAHTPPPKSSPTSCPQSSVLSFPSSLYLPHTKGRYSNVETTFLRSSLNFVLTDSLPPSRCLRGLSFSDQDPSLHHSRHRCTFAQIPLLNNMAPRTSALGLALIGKSASVDIPKPRDGGLNQVHLTDVSGETSKRPGMLPTPPHSISPNLPPHRSGTVSSANNNQESDVDLQDAPQNLTAEALDRLSELDSAGAVTPVLLAKHHLPTILLEHGPLAIRHIMGHLTATVPGFSRITSAKARRLVVAALEGKGNGSEGAGIDGDVIFDKVGWGRWDARKRGQPPRDHQNQTPPGSLPSSYSHGAMQVPDKQTWRSSSDRLGTSFATSGGFSHSDEYHDMLENEADNMSLDGDEGGYPSSEPQEPEDIEMDEGDVTDEEDWQSIGADALRARSLPPGSLPNSGGRIYQPAGYTNAPRYSPRPPLHMAKSVPVHTLAAQKRDYHYPSGINDSQERAAIEALLSLGSR